MESKLRVDIDSRGAKGKVDGLSGSLKKLTTSGEKASAQSEILGRTLRTVSGAAAGLGAAFGTGALVRTVTEIQGINSRISALTGNLVSDQAFLKQSANELGTEYSALASSYSNLLVAYDSGAASIEQVRDLTEGFANVAAKTGAGTDAMSRGIYGLNQALNAGIVSMEDYKQVVENFPGLANKIAQSAGKSVGALREEIGTGTLTSENFLTLVLDSLESFDGAAASKADNIAQTLNRTKTAYTLFVAEFEKPISEAVTAPLNLATDALELLGENAQSVQAVLGGVGVVLAANLGGSALSSIGDIATEQKKVFDKYVANQKRINDAVRVGFEQQQVVAAKAVKSIKEEGVARAELATISAKRAATEKAQAVAQKETTLLSAEKIALLKQEVLAESQVTLAVAKSTQAELARNVARAEQGALSATTNAVRLKYATSLEASTIAEARASTALTAAINAENIAKVESSAASFKADSASRSLATAKINEAKASTGVFAAREAERLSLLAASKAKDGVVVATANLNKAQAVVPVLSLRATAALRAQTVATVAMGTATRAGAAGLALLGGPAGVAFVAAGALAYYALKSTDAEKATDQLADAIDNLNDKYGESADAITRSTDEQIKATEKSIAAIENEILALDAKFSINIFQDLFDEGSKDDALAAISELRQGMADLRRESENLISASATGDEFDNLFGSAYDDSLDLSRALEVANDALSKLFPDEGKLAKLEELRKQLDGAKGSLDPERYKAGIRAIDEQIAKLGENTEAIRRAEQEAKKLESALNSAFESRSREIAHKEQIETLSKAINRGVGDVDVYARAIEKLEESFDVETAEIAAEKIRDLTDAMSARVQTPFSAYSDELKLLNGAIAALPDEASLSAENIQRAFSNFDFEVRANLTTVSGDGSGDLQRNFELQKEALAQFHSERKISEQQANADRLALQRSFDDQIYDLQRETQGRLIELGNASEGIRFNFDVEGTKTELDNLLRDLKISPAEHRAAEESAEEAHQVRLQEIIRSGGGTREQIEAAGFQGRLANILGRHEEEIQLVTTLADSLLSINEGRQRGQAEAAKAVYDTDKQAFEEAKRAFEQNGSEQNKLALAQAEERLRISEAEARRQFKQQKQAAKDSIYLSTAVAAANALASPPWGPQTFLKVGIALAQGAALLASVDSRKFTSTSGSTSTGANLGGSAQASAQANQAPPQANNYFMFSGAGLTTDQDVLEESMRMVEAGVQRGYIQNLGNNVKFQIPRKVKRIDLTS